MESEEIIKIISILNALIQAFGVLQSALLTTLAMVHTLPDGDRDFSFYRNPGADIMLTEDEIPEKPIAGAKIFHFGSLSMTHEGVRGATEKAVALAKKKGALISFDPNLRPPFWKSMEEAKAQIASGISNCDILKISDNEIQWYTGERDFDNGIRRLKERYDVPLILLSMGREGSRAYYKDLRIEAAPFLQKNTIETTGPEIPLGHAASILSWNTALIIWMRKN